MNLMLITKKQEINNLKYSNNALWDCFKFHIAQVEIWCQIRQCCLIGHLTQTVQATWIDLRSVVFSYHNFFFLNCGDFFKNFEANTRLVCTHFNANFPAESKCGTQNSNFENFFEKKNGKI